MFLFKKKYFKNTQPGVLSDLELINQYKDSGSNIFLEEIFNRYSHLIYGVCLKYLKNNEEAKDAVMQIFEELISKIKTNDISNFKSWIYTVAKNHCLMILRKKKNFRNDKFIDPDFMEILQEEHPINDDLERHIKNLDMAIQSLKEEQKQCIDLFYLQKKSYLEIVELTGFNEKQVKSYIQNGKRNLKNFLLKV